MQGPWTEAETSTILQCFTTVHNPQSNSKGQSPIYMILYNTNGFSL